MAPWKKIYPEHTQIKIDSLANLVEEQSRDEDDVSQKAQEVAGDGVHHIAKIELPISTLIITPCMFLTMATSQIFALHGQMVAE
ncbi:hypothetical protein Y032_0476g2143 [Ancylostoma ceylanicum]|uniref:Uncharacterized protein n=1 Tax=Ancylostoma ceylanicum TaxID=53326 RepID=A0A016WY37_9BILA|nr:hypothetical protein Y032_0476g2143 [Ancylostoma ceylanicum]